GPVQAGPLVDAGARVACQAAWRCTRIFLERYQAEHGPSGPGGSSAAARRAAIARLPGASASGVAHGFCGRGILARAARSPVSRPPATRFTGRAGDRLAVPEPVHIA